MGGLPGAIAEHRPSVVALGATAPWSAARLVETIHAIRAAEPALPIVLGGAQAARAARLAADPAVFVVPDAESVVQIVAMAVRSRTGP
jgi:hypothetical protein